jgi:hypothetical protein
MTLPFAIGFALLLVLSAFGMLAATAVASRASYDGPAERFLAAFVVWSALILLPVHVLGLTGTLTRVNLAIASLVVSAATFAVACWPISRVSTMAVLREMRGFVELPVRALALAWRAKSFILVAVIGAYGLLAWTTWISYLAPSDGWDGLWYHETMVGFAIQNHGYRIVEAHQHMTPVNSFPRNCEMISLWFVFFTDRRLIDVVNDIYAIPVMLALYCLTKRFCGNRLQAIGWACSLVLLPGFFLQLHSNYIDIHALSFYLAAIHFATRPTLRLRDGWMAALCLGLVLGAKSFALAWTPVLAAILLVRILRRHLRERPLQTLGTVAGGMTLIVGFGCIIYLRNWVHFGNPIWPYRIDMPKLGIHFPGFEPLSAMDYTKPFGQVLEDAMSPPKPGVDLPDTKQFGYGLAIPFMILPLAALALPWIAMEAAAALLRRVGGDGKGSDPTQVGNLLITALPPIATALHSIALYISRYNYQVVAGLFIVMSWIGRRLPRVAEAAIATCAMTGIMWLYWAKPAWFVDFKEATLLAKLPASERATRTTAGWSIAPETARARDRELGTGDVLAFTEDGDFYSLLWNERFSNRIVFVPLAPADRMMAQLEADHAKWFVTSSLTAAFDASPSWQRVGNMSSRVIAYRRVPPP